MKHDGPWQTVPGSNVVIFLSAVFCVFAGVAIAGDSSNMGRQPVVRFALSVLITAGFAVGYAYAGVTLRRRFWIAFVPLFLTQVFTMGFLANRFPDAPMPTQYNAAETARLQGRIVFDSSAIMVSVILGYVGFVVVSIREGRRHIRMQSEKAALESEMTAAREIQRAMVPEDLPPTPGYRIESIYRPAAQVGGDFFQVIPHKNTGTLIIVGDVSGKGLSAAMIVSMIVGMLHTVTAHTLEPAEILAELNRRLCGRTHGSFVTCAIARLESSGQVTFADAGHLPPYLNGAELSYAGSLPLGILESSLYEQTALHLHANDRMLLITDGIVEAQDPQGHLLGFPRVEDLLRDGATARTLAETAQQHGQADDITAICIERTAAAAYDPDRAAGVTLPVAS